MPRHTLYQIAARLDAVDAHAHITTGAHAGSFGANDLPTPTIEQAKADDYVKGVTAVQGIAFSVEQPQGSFRKGVDEGGTPWECRMAAHYGYFTGTVGADGDGVDGFIGPFPEADTAYVINQRNKDGSFDEHKVMCGFKDERHAREAYLCSYARGWTGLGAVVPLSISQLRWWLEKGDTKAALTPDQLPNDGRTKTMTKKVNWNDTLPEGATYDQVLYEARRMDGSDGLLLDSLSMADIMEDADSVHLLDALVVEYAQMPRIAERLRLVMERSGGDVKVPAVQVSEPFKARGVTNVAAVYELSDGQTVSIFFHNPDTTPNKLATGDELVSWKWLLNKKDITIVVAPEKGQDLNPRTVAQRIMKLAEKNSAAFQKANVKRAERLGAIQSLREAITQKEAVLKDLGASIEAAKFERERRDGEATVTPEIQLPVVIELTGTELGDFPETSAGFKAMNEAALSAANELDGKHVHNAALDADIYIRKSGNKKMLRLGASRLKMKLVPATLSLLGSGVKADESKPSSDAKERNIKAYHYLKSTVKVDGLQVAVYMVVKEDDKGHFLYEEFVNKKALRGIAGVTSTLDSIGLNGPALAQGTSDDTHDHLDGQVLDAVGQTMVLNMVVAVQDADGNWVPLPEDAAIDEGPVAEVDAAYQFANATDAFKECVADSVEKTDYSPFASAKAMDQKAKELGAEIHWGMGPMLDSVAESDEDEDFDSEAEFDACPVVDADEGEALDGDFKGHPFRGNQHKKASSHSHAAVRASISAKHAEKDGDAKGSKTAHKSAHYSHMAAAESTSGKARRYHRKMAKFHGGRSGMTLDSVVLDDAGDFVDSIVGKIMQGGKQMGRAVIGGDGKAMVFVGDSDDQRVTFRSKGEGNPILTASWSDDDAPDMVEWLLAPATPPVKKLSKKEAEALAAAQERAAAKANAIAIASQIDAIARAGLKLPEGISYKFDIEREASWMHGGPSNQISFYLDDKKEIGDASKFHAEARISLDRIGVILWADHGGRYAEQKREKLIPDNHLKADSYEDLANQIVQALNGAIEKHLELSKAAEDDAEVDAEDQNEQAEFNRLVNGLSDENLRQFGSKFVASRSLSRSELIKQLIENDYSIGQRLKTLKSMADSDGGPIRADRRGSDEPEAKFGWKILDDGGLRKKVPGYASIQSAKIAINKNPEWKAAKPEVVPFQYRDSGIGAKSVTRYVIVAKDQPAAKVEQAPEAVQAVRYALVNRPAMIGGLPSDLKYTVEPRPSVGQPHYDMARHGILVAERELTADELKRFELARLIDQDGLDAFAQGVIDSLGEYAARYAEAFSESPELLTDKVRTYAKNDKDGVSNSIGDFDAAVARVVALIGSKEAPKATVEVYAFKDASAEALGLLQIGAQNTATHSTYKTAVSVEKSADAHAMTVRWEAVSSLPTFDDATGGLFGDGDSGFIRGALNYNGTKLADVYLRDDGLTAFTLEHGMSEYVDLDEEDWGGWHDEWAYVIAKLQDACDSNSFAQRPAIEVFIEALNGKGWTDKGTGMFTKSENDDVGIVMSEDANKWHRATLQVLIDGDWVDMPEVVTEDAREYEDFPPNASEDEVVSAMYRLLESAETLQVWANEHPNGAEPAVTPEPAPVAPADNEYTRLNAALKAAPKDRETVASDDPQAIEKLERKLYALQLRQEFMKKTNKLIKKGDNAGLVAMGFNQATIEAFKKPDFAGRIGYPDYELTNNNGVISNTRKRLEELQRRAVEAAVIKQPEVPKVNEPTESTEKTQDRAFLMSVIDGTNPEILEPELVPKIEAAYQRNSADVEMVSLFSQAVNAYTQAMLNATAGVF